MKYAVTALLIPVLGSAFFGKSAEAIKCHHCNECADAKSLTESIECTKTTLAEAMLRLTLKLTGQPVSEQYVSMILEKMGVNNTEAPPASCFKLQKTVNNEDVVYRGCSSPYVDACEDVNEIRTCMCQDDGCNSAPAAFVASLITWKGRLYGLTPRRGDVERARTIHHLDEEKR